MSVGSVSNVSQASTLAPATRSQWLQSLKALDVRIVALAVGLVCVLALAIRWWRSSNGSAAASTPTPPPASVSSPVLTSINGKPVASIPLTSASAAPVTSVSSSASSQPMIATTSMTTTTAKLDLAVTPVETPIRTVGITEKQMNLAIEILEKGFYDSLQKPLPRERGEVIIPEETFAITASNGTHTYVTNGIYYRNRELNRGSDFLMLGLSQPQVLVKTIPWPEFKKLLRKWLEQFADQKKDFIVLRQAGKKALHYAQIVSCDFTSPTVQ